MFTDSCPATDEIEILTGLTVVESLIFSRNASQYGSLRRGFGQVGHPRPRIAFISEETDQMLVRAVEAAKRVLQMSGTRNLDPCERALKTLRRRALTLREIIAIARLLRRADLSSDSAEVEYVVGRRADHQAKIA